MNKGKKTKLSHRKRKIPNKTSKNKAGVCQHCKAHQTQLKRHLKTCKIMKIKPGNYQQNFNIVNSVVNINIGKNNTKQHVDESSSIKELKKQVSELKSALFDTTAFMHNFLEKDNSKCYNLPCFKDFNFNLDTNEEEKEEMMKLMGTNIDLISEENTKNKITLGWIDKIKNKFK